MYQYKSTKNMTLSDYYGKEEGVIDHIDHDYEYHNYAHWLLQAFRIASADFLARLSAAPDLSFSASA
jgi:hypothetical protein